MKRLFKIICIVSVLFTISLVSFNFLTSFSSGNKIYKDVYNYSNSTHTLILTYDLNKCYDETSQKLNFLNPSQKEYFTTIRNSIIELNDYFTFLSIKLSSEDKKTNKINNISNQLEDLKKARNSLLLDLEQYLIKLDGNTIGTFSTSVDYILNKCVDYLDRYSNTAINLNNLVNYNNQQMTEYYLINLHLQSIASLDDNYENLNFSNNIITTVNNLNEILTLSNNNFVLNESIYSTTAKQFNKYIKLSRTEKLINNYASYMYTNINPNYETDSSALAFYYLNKLTEVQ